MPYELIEEEIPKLQSRPQESSLGFLGRTGARSLARGAEAVVGLPGDIVSALHTGLKTIAPKEYVQASQKENLPNVIPTSQDIREKVTKKLTGDYLEPQGSGENFWDEIVGDAATIFMPTKGKVPLKNALFGSLGRSALGNTAKWAAEEVTGSPLIGAATKIGTMALAGTIGGRKELEKVKNISYEKAFSSIDPDKKFSIAPERQKIDSLIHQFSKGDKPDRDFIIQRLKSIDNIGNSNIKDAIALKQDWNQHLSDPYVSKASKDAIKKGVSILNESIARYGSQNPQFFTPYKIGEELTGALNSTNYVQKIFSQSPYLQQSIKNPTVRNLFYGGAFSIASKFAGVPKAIAATSTVAGISKAAQAYQLLARSPIARKYYKGVIESTLKNDTKNIIRNLSQLDKTADKFETKNELMDNDGRYELID